MTIELFLSFAGLFVLLWRTQPWRRDRTPRLDRSAMPTVSIIVPCRNEEANVIPLLRSLQAMEGIEPEFIIVDDGSSDQTVTKATAMGVRVLQAPERPSGWIGKSWACWQGAHAARGQVLLFTDADTRHAPDSLLRAVSFMKDKDAQLISAPPFHLCENKFEKWLGLFHILPMVAAAINECRNPRRLYAIGQYLLISREAYFQVGGHERVRASLAEDIDLARAVLENSLRYSIFPEAGLYQVQMYASWSDFWRGWKRLLRIGMRKVSFASFVEVVLVFHLFFHFSIAMLLGIGVLIWIQRRNGKFSLFGAPLAVLSLAVFTILSLMAAWESLWKKEIVWRERAYADV